MFEKMKEEIYKRVFVDDKYDSRKWKSGSNQLFKKELQNIEIFDFETPEEKIWAILNGVDKRPVCVCR